MRAMILAAGRGERLRPMTDTMPKALLDVHGKSLLERQLENIRDAGITTVVINLGWLGDQIVGRIGSGARYGLDIIYSQEGDNVLETGGGIYKALPLLGDSPFLVANADAFTDLRLAEIEPGADSLGHLVLVPTPAYREHGDFDLRGGLVRNSSAPQLTFSGIAIYSPEFFDGCSPGRFPLAPMLRAAADAGQLSGELYRGRWADVGTPQRLRDINRL